MITYLYWLAFIAAVFGIVYLFGYKLSKWRVAVITAATVLLVGLAAYELHFENVFVKRWGGVMTIKTPANHHHIATTWKDDNLWVESYNPAKNECTFSEYSKGNVLQGKVTIKDCNPVLPAQPARPIIE